VPDRFVLNLVPLTFVPPANFMKSTWSLLVIFSYLILSFSLHLQAGGFCLCPIQDGLSSSLCDVTNGFFFAYRLSFGVRAVLVLRVWCMIFS